MYVIMFGIKLHKAKNLTLQLQLSQNISTVILNALRENAVLVVSGRGFFQMKSDLSIKWPLFIDTQFFFVSIKSTYITYTQTHDNVNANFQRLPLIVLIDSFVLVLITRLFRLYIKCCGQLFEHIEAFLAILKYHCGF